MSNSQHRDNHLKHKAIKDANSIYEGAGSQEPEKNPMNTEFKKQFEAKENALPHHPCKQYKQVSKRTCPCEENHDSTPVHVHHENERVASKMQMQTNEKSFLLSKKLSKQQKK